MSACSSSPTSAAAHVDGGSARPPSSFRDASAGGGTPGTASDAGAGTFTTSIRFAHLAPGLGSVDFCWRASANDPFHGPLLGSGPAVTDFDGGLPGEGDASSDASSDAAAGDASAREDAGIADAGRDPDDAGDAADTGALGGDAMDAGPAPLGYLSVSPTVSLVSTGEIDVIAVEPGTSCAAPLVLGHVVLPATPRTTLLLAGGAQADASGGLGILAFGDEVTASAVDGESLRVVNAALVPDLGSFSAAFDVAGTIIPLAAEVDPRSPSAGSLDGGAPEIDALGYTSVPPTQGEPQLRIALADAQATGDGGDDAGALTTWLSAPRPYALTAGEITTAFVGHDASGYVVLWCNDHEVSEPDAGASFVAVR